MDFTLQSYKDYLRLLRDNHPLITTFRDLFRCQQISETFALIRHDVDRFPNRALAMARLERSLDLVATYYFRTKPGVFQPAIIKAIYDLGHEIGYHYEDLSDARGDMRKALELFQRNLEKLRTIVPVETIAMHGRPLLPYDNRDLWRDPIRHALLQEKFGILGEVYLDIDYTDIAYISDTGRNWRSTAHNLRDMVKSTISTDFLNQGELVQYLSRSQGRKVVFQIHPERWTDSFHSWLVQYVTDGAVNVAKQGARMLSGLRTAPASTSAQI
jgi:hypothetical protein